jgi:hypothetical protein
MAKAINEHAEMGLHTRAGDDMVGWRGLSEESEDWEGDGDLNVGCGLDEGRCDLCEPFWRVLDLELGPLAPLHHLST